MGSDALNCCSALSMCPSAHALASSLSIRLPFSLACAVRRTRATAHTSRERCCGGQVAGLLADDKVRDLDKLRVVLLYALRYQKEAEEKGVLQQLQRQLPARPLEGSLASTSGGEDLPLPRPYEFPEVGAGRSAELCQQRRGGRASAARLSGLWRVVLRGLTDMVQTIRDAW